MSTDPNINRRFICKSYPTLAVRILRWRSFDVFGRMVYEAQWSGEDMVYSPQSLVLDKEFFARYEEVTVESRIPYNVVLLARREGNVTKEELEAFLRLREKVVRMCVAMAAKAKKPPGHFAFFCYACCNERKDDCWTWHWSGFTFHPQCLPVLPTE